MRQRSSLLLALVLIPACAAEPPPPAPPPPPPPPPAPVVVAPPPRPVYQGLDRLEFNRNAVRANLPIYWVSDANHDGIVDPPEVVPLRFYPTVGIWTDDNAFTPDFDRAWQTIKAAGTIAASTPPTPEDRRRALVAEDLDQGLSTLVASDFTSSPPDDRAFVIRMLRVARMIDDLYATQIGMAALAPRIAEGDDLSKSLFRRNWGPRCVAPLTEKNPECTAIPGAPKPLTDAYPAELQADPTFCTALEKLPNAKALLDPFVVVRKDAAGKLAPVPLTQAYQGSMSTIADELRKAADAVTDPAEASLKEYLMAASASFRTNDWVPADEAWSRMTVTNSRWYVRVAPDEVYWDPCGHKAAFHLTFARINRESLAWQAKFDPVRQEMEQSLAKHIGAPYKPRKVSFHLPDFIDIIVNAGNDREALGGAIGESLPNWGPVAASGRGRTVAMVNLFTDPDSVAIRRKQAESLLTKETMAAYDDSSDPGLLDTILHEATHNLGPGHEYKVGGKNDAQAFGGPLASMLEELKAQTGTLYYLNFAVEKGLLNAEAARRSYVSTFAWALGHISRGMYTEAHAPKAYSQLAAIQVGFLMDEGAITFDAAAPAADGSVGAFAIHFDKMPAAVDKMMKVVGHIKATSDKKAALALAARYVDGDRVPQKLVTERELKYPKQSLVYAVRL